MDKAKKLRSELIAHIQSEAAKEKSEGSSGTLSPEESSLFENRIRLFLTQNSSEYEKSIQAVLNEIYSTTRESSDFWTSSLEIEEESKVNIKSEDNG